MERCCLDYCSSIYLVPLLLYLCPIAASCPPAAREPLNLSVEIYMSQSLPSGFCSDVTYHRDFPALSIQNKIPVLSLHPLAFSSAPMMWNTSVYHPSHSL